MVALTLFTSVVPAEGLTDALNVLINQINANVTLAGLPQSVAAVSLGTAFSQASNTTLANLVGLSLPLVAGGTYRIRGQLQGAAAASGGIKAALTAASGLTLTSANVTGWNYNGSTLNAVTNVTALAADFSNSAAAYTNLLFDGSFVVNAAGNVQLQAAQNTSNATATTVALGSYVEVLRIA